MTLSYYFEIAIRQKCIPLIYICQENNTKIGHLNWYQSVNFWPVADGLWGAYHSKQGDVDPILGQRC